MQQEKYESVNCIGCLKMFPKARFSFLLEVLRKQTKSRKQSEICVMVCNLVIGERKRKAEEGHASHFLRVKGERMFTRAHLSFVGHSSLFSRFKMAAGVQDDQVLQAVVRHPSTAESVAAAVELYCY